MKTLSLVLCFWVLIYFGHSQTNIYYPLPDTNAGWNEKSGGVQSMDCKDYHDVITGDTIVNGFVYHKLQRSGVHYWDNYLECSDIIWFYFNYYIGAYRNDSINKKVFFLPLGASSDSILYDFNLCLNCPLPQTYIYDSTLNYHICIIDSILIGEQYRKRYRICSQNINNPHVGDLIEGIGSTLGLLDHIFQPFEHYTELVCFQQNGMTLYSVYDTTYYDCTMYTVGIENIKDKRLEVKLVPNPVQDECRIIINENIQDLDFQLINFNGKVIFKKLKISNEMVVPFKELPNGLYFYIIRKNGVLISKNKLIKLN
jgi:hypothetical protein